MLKANRSPVRAVTLWGLILGALLIPVAGCGGGGDGTATTAASSSGGATDTTAAATDTTAAAESAAPVQDAKVSIVDFAYDPEPIKVKIGGTVTWTNSDVAPHTATAKNRKDFDTGTLQTGDQKTITFSKAGTFHYYCLFHPFMAGTVEVTN